MLLKKLISYLNPATWFKSGEGPFNLRVMHGINRISILLFMFCLAVMIYRWLT